MEFKFIDDLGLDIRIDLTPLRRNSQRYKILMYQHEGIFSADAHKFGNAIPVDSQFNAFFEKAKETNADLVLTPEYSCPWSIIKSIMPAENKWPDEGKIWCIGCESITKEEIGNFKNDFVKDNTIIYYDESINENTNSFLDPLIYLFIAKKNGLPILVCLIQFKTKHMGVWGGGEIERNNLIQGKEIYVLRNDPQSIYFTALICSDAIDFRTDFTEEMKNKIDWVDKPYLIYHPQLNPDPAHSYFTAFRNFIFSFQNKEIISLNWQVDSKIGVDPILRYQCSRSGFYVKSNEINLEDRKRIINNHKKGLFYFNNKNHRHTYLLSSSPHCFLIETLPVMITAGQLVQRRRDGPEAIEIFVLNPQKDTLESKSEITDMHIKYLGDAGCSNAFLLDASKCVLEKERLISLSIAEIDDTLKNIDKVYSIGMDDTNEINFRITLGQDRKQETLDKKSRYIEAVNSIQDIINQSKFPDSLKNFNGKAVKLAYHDLSHNDEYRFNLVAPTGEKIYATVSYLVSPDDTLIDEKYSKLRKLFKDTEIRYRERVVIFYKRELQYQAKWDKSFGSITETHKYEDDSILKNE